MWNTTPLSQNSSSNEFRGSCPADQTWVYEQYKELRGCLSPCISPSAGTLQNGFCPHRHCVLANGQGDTNTVTPQFTNNCSWSSNNLLILFNKIFPKCISLDTPFYWKQKLRLTGTEMTRIKPLSSSGYTRDGRKEKKPEYFPCSPFFH